MNIQVTTKHLLIWICGFLKVKKQLHEHDRSGKVTDNIVVPESVESFI